MPSRLRFAAVALAVLAVSVLASPPAPAKVFSPTLFSLPNGMQVVVVENHRAPVVSHMVWYKVGAMDEPPGKSGIAHFLEHLMFKGTDTMPPGAFSRMVSLVGGNENAFTSTDYTAYYQTVAKEHLDKVMKAEADRMTHLVLTQEQIDSERQVVLEERRQRTDNDPSSVLSELTSATLFLNHPYRKPIIGWAHEIAGLSRDDILAFYRSFYAPNNAILVVAGDVTPDEVRKLAETHYGAIPPSQTIHRVDMKEPPQRAPRDVTLRDARVQQPRWSRTYLAPSYVYGETKHAYALQVLSSVLGEGPTSRLYRKLVIELGIADSAGSFYGGMNRGPARFGIYAAPKPGVSLDRIEEAVAAVIDEAKRTGFTPEEIERAKNEVRVDAVYARDSLRAGANVLGAALAIGLKVDDVESEPDRIAAVTPEMISEAMEYVLDPAQSVTSHLLPNGEPGKAKGGRS